MDGWMGFGGMLQDGNGAMELPPSLFKVANDLFSGDHLHQGWIIKTLPMLSG
jgi:hypothetical protein